MTQAQSDNQMAMPNFLVVVSLNVQTKQLESYVAYL
jgi:hypothetical protein